MRPLLLVGDDSCMRTVGDEVSLDLDRLATDLEAVRVAQMQGFDQADDGTLAAAAAAFAGNFLEGLDLPAAARFSTWCAGEREHVHATRRAVPWSTTATH